jgi:hypothetical protein
MGEEVWDALTATNALQTIVDLLNWEMMEPDGGEKGQVADLKAVIERLKNFIASEIKEDHSAATEKTVEPELKKSEDKDDVKIMNRVDARIAVVKEALKLETDDIFKKKK